MPRQLNGERTIFSAKGAGTIGSPYATNGASLVVQTVKNLPSSEGGTDLIPGWTRSPGEGNSNPLQYSFLGYPMDRGAWQATRVHAVTKELDMI